MTAMFKFKKHHPPPGSRPGTLVIDRDAPAPRIRVIHYTADTVREDNDVDVHRLSAEVPAGSVVWVDVQGFGDESTIRRIGELFGLHRLVVEDVVNVPQRPKAEAYEEQLLLVTRTVRLLRPLNLDIGQISIVLGTHYVITFQERPGDVLEPVRRRLQGVEGAHFRRQGADYLAYALLDAVVDGHYPVLEGLGDQLEDLEESIINEPTPHLLRKLNDARHNLSALRRSLGPQREAVNMLLRDPNPLVSEDVRLYLRDVYDHCVQTAETVDSYRESVGGLLNTYLSSMANRTNEVMKILTIMASIFIPLTFLAGIYGMNFQNMPELQVWWAYPLLWLVMILVAVGMLIFFYRKRWIGSRWDRADDPNDDQAGSASRRDSRQ
jgi:magnesium transporter